METLKKKPLSYRAQALIILVIVAGWHLNWWIVRQPGERYPVICEVLFLVVPLLTTVLSYIVLDTRMRDRQPCDAWFWAGLFGGIVPWVSMVI